MSARCGSEPGTAHLASVESHGLGMLGRRLSRKQIALSIGIGIVMVSILAAMTGSLTRDQLLVGTAAMTVVGLVMIWFSIVS